MTAHGQRESELNEKEKLLNEILSRNHLPLNRSELLREQDSRDIDTTNFGIISNSDSLKNSNYLPDSFSPHKSGPFK